MPQTKIFHKLTRSQVFVANDSTMVMQEVAMFTLLPYIIEFRAYVQLSVRSTCIM